MCAILIRLCTCIGVLLISFSSFAAIEVHEFDNEVDRERYQTFIDEMRCPKCPNQNLAGTNSPIAEDLRRELDLMIKEGRSDKEIVDFMVDRYGEFILYRPRLSPATMFLWGAPIFLLVVGVIMLLLIVRKRRRIDSGLENGLSVTDQARLDRLLNPSNKNNTEASDAKYREEKK